MVKNMRFAKINSINPLYLIIDEISGYLEESNGNKYLAILPTDESKDNKKYDELWSKIRDSILPITNKSDNYDE